MDGIGDVAEQVGADFRVPHIATGDRPGGQPKVQHHELLLRHDHNALSKRSKCIVVVLLDGCQYTQAGISLMKLLSRETNIAKNYIGCGSVMVQTCRSLLFRGDGTARLR